MSRRLGRGLDALIPSLDIHEDDQVVQLELTRLRANPYQPRKTFDQNSLQELAASIREHGIIQPIIVRNVLKDYEIIAGERRFRAAQICGLKTIPAVIRTYSDQQVMEIALIENVQREDLNAIEIAVAYHNIMTKLQVTQEELSVKVGKSRSYIANFLRLLQLPEKIKDYVSRGTLSMGHAKCLVSIKDEKVKSNLAELAIRSQWSVRELEEEVQKLETPASPPKRKVKKEKTDVYLVAAEEQLTEQFKTKVKIKNKKNSGTIELTYYSKDDLNRLLDMFGSLK
jgi:ParB family chromosome partitioning protein